MPSFDRQSASYAVGLSDGSGYFGPSFASERATLDWAARNLPRIERQAVRNEPWEPELFVAYMVETAAFKAGDDPRAFADALAPRMDEIRAEAATLRERDLDDLFDEIEDASVSPSEMLSRLSDFIPVTTASAPAP